MSSAPAPSAGASAAPQPQPRVRIELKLMVAAAQIEVALRALGLASARGQRRSIVYFDDKARSLYRAGVVLRARQRGAADDADDDVTVKLRAPRAGVAAWMRRVRHRLARGARGDFKCERDSSVAPGAAPGRISCSLSVERQRRAVAAASAGTRSVRSLLSPAQQRMLAGASVRNAAALKLRPVGPATVWRVKRRPVVLGGKRVTIEHWRLPGGRQLLELSLKTGARKAARRAELLRRWARRLGVTAYARGASKTRAVLAGAR